MKATAHLMVAVLLILSTGCCDTQTQSHKTGERTAQPEWIMAREKLNLDPADIALGPSVEERGARASESVTVGDTISLTHRGWIYTWKIKSVQDSQVDLEQVEATRLFKNRQ